MLRCPRCPNGAVLAENAGGGPGVSPNSAPLDASPATRPAPGTPYLDISLTLPQLPTILRCRNCGWARSPDGMPMQGSEADNRQAGGAPVIPYADSTSEIALMELDAVPLHPGLDAGGRNDDLVQRRMRMPAAVLCETCGGPSPRCGEADLKASIQSFKNLPQPPSGVETRASFWAFHGSSNFAGRPVILDWYFVVTRFVEGQDASKDDLVDLCVGCGRPCFARYRPPRDTAAAANKTAPLPADWAEKQREREREYRRRNPKRIAPDRDPNTGLPVPGTGGWDFGDGDVRHDGPPPGGFDDSDGDGNANANNNNDDDAQPDENGNVVRQLIPGAPPLAGPAAVANNNQLNRDLGQAHDHLANAQLVAGGDGPQLAAVVADPAAVKEATVARLAHVQQVRVMEEARKSIVTLLEALLGPHSTWPRSIEQVTKKRETVELWTLAGLIWLLASASPTKTGAVIEWSIARDFLVKQLFKTDVGQQALDTLLCRDPRDPDILVWAERWIGVHVRCGALIFARRLHDVCSLQPFVTDQLRCILRDALGVASRSRALRLMAAPSSPATRPREDSAAAAAATTSTTSNNKPAYSDNRIVRVPINWVTPHSWNTMQSKAFRFAHYILRAAYAELRAEKKAVFLVQVRLMMRFAGDATAITEGSFFSLICGLPYNDPESRDYVVLDGRDERLRPVLGLGLDRLVRISRGANWAEPNANWATMLTVTQHAATMTPPVRDLIARLPAPETIATVKVIACHEDIQALGGAAVSQN